jgi:hypothetical protein
MHDSVVGWPWLVIFGAVLMGTLPRALRGLGPPMRAFMESAHDFANEYNAMYVD